MEQIHITLKLDKQTARGLCELIRRRAANENMEELVNQLLRDWVMINREDLQGRGDRGTPDVGNYDIF